MLGAQHSHGRTEGIRLAPCHRSASGLSRPGEMSADWGFESHGAHEIALCAFEHAAHRADPPPLQRVPALITTRSRCERNPCLRTPSNRHETSARDRCSPERGGLIESCLLLAGQPPGRIGRVGLGMSVTPRGRGRRSRRKRRHCRRASRHPVRTCCRRTPRREPRPCPCHSRPGHPRRRIPCP